jgi:adenylate kinase family enzyme
VRINVIGTSGSGKTTFGRKLAETLDLPFIELDALFWGPNWTFPEDGPFFQKLENELTAESWVLDGNYTRTLERKWERVQAVVWINYNFPRTIYQAMTRAITRLFSQEELWPGTGNRENLKMLFSKDSIVLWTLKSYHRHKKRNIGYIYDQKFSHIKFHRIRSPNQGQEFLKILKDDPGFVLESEFGIARN